MSNTKMKGPAWWGTGDVWGGGENAGDHHGAKIFRLKPEDTGKLLGGFNRGWRRG